MVVLAAQVVPDFLIGRPSEASFFKPNSNDFSPKSTHSWYRAR